MDGSTSQKSMKWKHFVLMKWKQWDGGISNKSENTLFQISLDLYLCLVELFAKNESESETKHKGKGKKEKAFFGRVLGKLPLVEYYH